MRIIICGSWRKDKAILITGYIVPKNVPKTIDIINQ